MSYFLISFITIYTCMHAFVFIRARALWTGRWPAQVLCTIVMAMLIFAPIATRLLERNGNEPAARLTAYAGYAWMGFIFICFWAFILATVIELAMKALNGITGMRGLSLSDPTHTIAVFGIVAAVSVYGFFEARSIRTEHITIQTDKLPEGVERLKIAQISDVHLGLLNREKRLNAIAEKIRSENPDILVSTGDLVDGSFEVTDGIADILGEIKPKYGKFAVTGNHEYYAGLAQAIDFTESMGFTMLRGEAKTAGGVINVVGVDDLTGGNAVSEASLLSSTRNGLFTLLLKHRPDVLDKSRGLFELQLSGHTHRGQIFPFCLITGMVYPMQDGLYNLREGSQLYTSRGTGTWGPPMRVLSPPEVTIIELRKSTKP